MHCNGPLPQVYNLVNTLMCWIHMSKLVGLELWGTFVAFALTVGMGTSLYFGVSKFWLEVNLELERKTERSGEALKRCNCFSQLQTEVYLHGRTPFTLKWDGEVQSSL